MEVIGKQDQHELPFLGRVRESAWTLTRTDVRLVTTQFKKKSEHHSDCARSEIFLLTYYCKFSAYKVIKYIYNSYIMYILE